MRKHRTLRSAWNGYIRLLEELEIKDRYLKARHKKEANR